MDLRTWNRFLMRISETYVEADEDRYLNERSVELSSRELFDLNKKLENAQHIAKIGYWQYNKETNSSYFSKEFFSLLSFGVDFSVSNIKNLSQFVHEKDLVSLQQWFAGVFSSGSSYAGEVRIRKPGEAFHWYYVLAHPVIQENEPISQLSGIVMDITKRKQAEEEITLLHQKLLLSARQAGMAEVATAILHNVGNVLNSANISMNLLQETLSKSHHKKLSSVIDLIKKNLLSEPNYLTEHSKGKLIPEYLISVSTVIEQEYNHLLLESTRLNEHLNHIKEIVSMQKTISGVAGVTEKFLLSELIEGAIHLSGKITDENQISLKKYYQGLTLFIVADRSKLTQILVNLVQNAKDSLLEHDSFTQKEISIAVTKQGGPIPMVNIIVSDNGVGIMRDNLTKIFSYGFTTKKKGNGFGLHMSAIAAKEMGGSLTVESQGPGQGASFTLSLPLNCKEQGRCDLE